MGKGVTGSDLLLRSITDTSRTAVWGAAAEGPVRMFPGSSGSGGEHLDQESAEMKLSRRTQVTFWKKMHLKHSSFILSPRVFTKF